MGSLNHYLFGKGLCHEFVLIRFMRNWSVSYVLSANINPNFNISQNGMLLLFLDSLHDAYEWLMVDDMSGDC